MSHQIIKSYKNTEKVCFNGHMYTKHYITLIFDVCRCSKASSLKCPGKLKTSKENPTEIPIIDKAHTHPSDTHEVEVNKCLARMKHKAATTSINPIEIYCEELGSLDNETRARMPPETITKRTLRNQRSKNYLKEPRPLDDCIIKGDWALTNDGLRLLLKDSIEDQFEDRVIIFATDEGLKHLTEAETWMFDGNFALAPSIFQQVYIIRVKIHDLYITTVYCLLEKKTQTTYEYMLQSLLNACHNQNLYPDPINVHIDFEKAAINAVTSILGEHVNIKGCFFHLTQSTYRKIQSLGLVNVYMENENFSLFCRKIDALAFLPIDDVPAGMDYIKSIMPDEARELVNYFDQTYISGINRPIGISRPGKKTKFRNIPPIFPPVTWNVHETTIKNLERTNNQTEGFIHRFSKLVSYNHPSIWTLIKKIRLEIDSDSTKIAQFDN